MLTVNNLSIEFKRYGSGWRRAPLHPVRDLSLQIGHGEIVAVVGSSGSGKSLLAHAVLGLLPKNARITGDILFKGEAVTPRSIPRLRGRQIALIPQSVAYLNPLSRVGRQVYRASRLSGQCCRSAARNTDTAFARYRLENEVKAMFPFQVSGGMARRVLTATATAGDAALLIADEPTTGLDPAVARQSLHHLRELADSGKSIMLITHDLDAAVTIADRVAVIYAGTTVEMASARDFREREKLRHPYTQALWNALPQQNFGFVPGNQPMEDRAVAGCIYGDRCPKKTAECLGPQPLRPVGDGQVRCCHA
ncbi:oligopeptide/dipeptide ABC transporter ATP-binding protein [Pseudodesulfovibrio portus]|uniref:Nickel import system ATP-binding protein NikD n=1 Tax=Pseudodesulfovibrio portus TaxID=231439 RepID=A0ABN6RVD1_9BACT|nr:ABC transporter ATP-binding protein [Pseudodesulfovibrio portus]BDQ33517.1 ABC transporter ATP-binding protein [Pseudodesulfovibrio portus]